MARFIDPKEIGLPRSTKIEQLSATKFNLMIDRKSRIIMKDGQAILAKAQKIQDHFPKAVVCLKTSAPVCSKTIAFLQNHSIKVLPLA